MRIAYLNIISTILHLHEKNWCSNNICALKNKSKFITNSCIEKITLLVIFQYNIVLV